MSTVVKGMIFAAGTGSRLRPLTDRIPKALVDVGGVTMLERTIRRMADAGVTSIVINIHHHAAQIADFLHTHGNFGLDIRLSDETERLLDTGGGILKAAPLLVDADAVVVHNADILTDIPLVTAVQAHLRSRADASLMVAPRHTSRYLLFDDDATLRGWENVTTGELRPASLSRSDADSLMPRGFCGIHILRPRPIFAALGEYAADIATDVFSMTPFYVASCHRLTIKGLEIPSGSMWIDIGKPDTLAQARALFP